MWQTKGGGVYLEPGEVAALRAALQHALPQRPPHHPSELMLAALVDALSDVGNPQGIILSPATPAVVQDAARAFFLPAQGPNRMPPQQ